MSEHGEDVLWLQSRCPWREGTESAEGWYGEQREAVDRILTRLEAAEAERDALRDKCESGHWLSDDEWYAGERANADFLLRYHALLAEHEAWIAFVASGRTMDALTAFERAHDNAERVIRG